MKLVINIDDELYKSICNHRNFMIFDKESPYVAESIINGTPLPKAHWIEHSHEAGPNWEYSMYECSKCHGWLKDDSDYCPNCGAKMESEVEE